jgi:CheY-like chemotaxis protein
MPAPHTILLVDDDETTNFLHRRLLKRLNVVPNIEVATNGEEALQFLVDYCQLPEASEKCPLLIFLDIKMPVMDGFEFLTEYEQLADRLHPAIQINMLTSSVNPMDLERLGKFSGEYKHYSKPLSEEIIQEVLARHFS